MHNLVRKVLWLLLLVGHPQHVQMLRLLAALRYVAGATFVIVGRNREMSYGHLFHVIQGLKRNFFALV
jgi:hypothetical protein